MANTDDVNLFKHAFLRHERDFKASIEKNLPAIFAAANILVEAIKNRSQLLVCGNGGSAADAQHFVAEWVCKYGSDRKPFRAIALTTNTSALTAIGNDYGFEYIFKRQVEAIGESGDVLVAISTSGKSANITKAIDQARKQGLKIVVMTGAKGSDLEKVADAAIIVPSEETARIQEFHEFIYHSWCEFIDSVLL